MKKIRSAVFVSLIVLAMTACGSNDQVGEASPPAQTPEAVIAAQNTDRAAESNAEATDSARNAAEASESKAEADRQETGAADLNESSAGSDDEYQNPTMNFVGPYVADSAEMDVSAAGKSDAEFKVEWSKEDSTVSVWTMSGEMDADTFTVEYENCEKTDYVYNEDGSLESETSVYDDGTGRIIFNPQDGTLVWEDEKEHAADSLIFEYSYSVAEAAETGELG